MSTWLLLVLGLPTANATERMRAWRALKACGSAVLRDGVYLLPEHPAGREALETVEREVLAINGTAYLLQVQGEDERFIPLFDRREDYARLCGDIAQCRDELTGETALQAARQARKLRKAFAQLSAIDFFPGEARQQADSALEELETAIGRTLSADEPYPSDAPVALLAPGDFQGRRWATRKRPWVDRLASAWLIRRFIDPQAQILWLDSPGDCPADALGFDFDGAAFSHAGRRVTFETLLASFQLESTALIRIGAIVHYLDIGGLQPAEASGIERVLAGLRAGISDDDLLLQAAGSIFDGLLTAFADDEKNHD
ncbi:chromate resistance protein [Pseudomonas sp. ZM23]|uniref:Chromate resistance protein n=1 Tax=Pseudomonas triclosanedens TaxID=2961893 RepID=A0ABY7A5R6_9PSED|nr:chromate resistance protein ChrB domain-containing protein [Pseudomonas triclosanedens]MCP8467559.1 chromate resistance protein [Pseudomonas triclosanedens]MCP8471736.1 chromate resistance protein [Pseudomonas triclosanedens]MCP8478911.1 chromate resistance protein [Pseudomonas triclosanedens]WAI52394.1 chromate resistance protein [Pseudomonas triclosanedens]